MDDFDGDTRVAVGEDGIGCREDGEEGGGGEGVEERGGAEDVGGGVMGAGATGQGEDTGLLDGAFDGIEGWDVPKETIPNPRSAT